MVCEEDISLPLGNTDANCMSPSYPTATVSPGLILSTGTQNAYLDCHSVLLHNILLYSAERH